MSRRFTVIWLAYGNPVCTKITLPRPYVDGFSEMTHDKWLALALIAYRREIGEDWDWDRAMSYIQDTGPGLAAVVKGHKALVYAT